jgi:hypothetical protein
VEDLLFLLRKDKKKFARVRDLISKYQEITDAKKAFKDMENVVVSNKE